MKTLIHAEAHSPDAFCGNAGPEEMRHLTELVEELTDNELKQLVDNVGITFMVEGEIPREEYEHVIDEAAREDFYREYRKIIEKRHKKKN